MLATGTKLGPYEILAAIGAGGMGEVYRAHDTRLGRDVAIKVLSPHLATTPEVRARFEREARTISQLNHPHICVLHDIGHQGGVAGREEAIDYLVMELLDGETLARRLEKGPLPTAEVLALGKQIADALDRAHRAGVVHRDLKPGNVMLTKAGAKLMDFGLARAAGPATAAPGGLTQSPTVSRPLTAEGTIVGTFQYMAPEQLEGRDADARSDIWALGCVLYEAATGRRAFEGKSQASLIAAIMEREPTPPSQVVPLLPPTLDRVVQQCLAKDPDERIQTAHDVKLELQWIAEGGSQAGVPAPVAARRRSRERFAWGLAAAAATLAIVALGLLLLRRREPPQLTRFEVNAPRGTTNIMWPRVSPDGRTLAFLASDSTGNPRLWVRPLDAVEARPLAGVQNARPFWSPDSRYLAFIDGGRLRKIPVAGGPPTDICAAPGGADGTWGKSGWILFDGTSGDSIRGVRDSGGTPEGITYLDHAHGENQHAWPFFLPDGQHFLFVAREPGGARPIRLGRLGSRESRTVGYTDYRAEYGPPGYLLYMREGVLMAQPFDARAARTTGDPVPLSEVVTGGVGPFSVSSGGVVAYQPRGSRTESRLLWVDRAGRTLGTAAPAGAYEDVVLSPDGGRLALSAAKGQPDNFDIWVRDLARGTSLRLTFDAPIELSPIWSPDGSRIAFGRLHRGMRCYIAAANGVGGEDSLVHTEGLYQAPLDWSGAAHIVLIGSVTTSYNWDLWVAADDGRQAPRPYLTSRFDERWGRLSPDGRWLAYASNESGRDEVYVIPYPGPGNKWQISTSGGSFPQWRADGKELFFQGPDQTISAVEVRSGADFEAGAPKALFKASLTEWEYLGYRWAVSPDGQRFLVNTPSGAEEAARFVVVLNWTAGMGRK